MTGRGDYGMIVAVQLGELRCLATWRDMEFAGDVLTSALMQQMKDQSYFD